jgi:hypothetical protein
VVLVQEDQGGVLFRSTPESDNGGEPQEQCEEDLWRRGTLGLSLRSLSWNGQSETSGLSGSIVSGV